MNDSREIAFYTKKVMEDGFCVMEGAFSPAILRDWANAFAPLLQNYLASGGSELQRGPSRYYVTLPFTFPFANPMIYENDLVLAIIEQLVGKDFVMCQLATDTPLLGSEYQDVHRDAPPLFPELEEESPAFQLAVNFPLVDVTLENGPIEIAAGTHRIPKARAMDLLAHNELALEPIPMKVGDVMIRDVRGLHRGTPNHSSVPRPMAVIGYSRKWLHRPEVSIDIPRETWSRLSDRARHMLRFNSIVETLGSRPPRETYDTFAY